MQIQVTRKGYKVVEYVTVSASDPSAPIIANVYDIDEDMIMPREVSKSEADQMADRGVLVLTLA